MVFVTVKDQIPPPKSVIGLSPGFPKVPPPAINIPVESIVPPVLVIEATFKVNVILTKLDGGGGQEPSVSQLPKQC